MKTLAWRLGRTCSRCRHDRTLGEIAALTLVSPVFLPAPARTWTALWQGFAHADLAAKLFGTIRNMIGEWLVASFFGVALGALVGASKAAREYVEPTFEFLRPLPA